MSSSPLPAKCISWDLVCRFIVPVRNKFCTSRKIAQCNFLCAQSSLLVSSAQFIFSALCWKSDRRRCIRRLFWVREVAFALFSEWLHYSMVCWPS